MFKIPNPKTATHSSLHASRIALASTFSTRRTLIKGAAALALGSVAPPLLLSSAAEAIAPAVIAAAIVLVSKVLDFFKSSGDMTLELNALNVKIDQVLQNQLLMMAAIVGIESKVEEIQQKIADLPTETVTLDRAIRARSLSSLLANTISTLSKHPTDPTSRADYQRYRQEINENTSDLYSVVADAEITPALAIGAKSALHALTLFSRFDKHFGYDGPSDRDKLWPAPGSTDTELGVLMESEVCHGETEVYTRVQARGCASDQRAGRLVCAGFARSQCASVPAAQLGEGACG
jgi:hypothetical protein